ncbi:MAG: tetratricopeptide repeat protein [Proteobacteria bacterium]|nr:tetratricopeptide repeat protein [Pseudomonadota bacterium]
MSGTPRKTTPARGLRHRRALVALLLVVLPLAVFGRAVFFDFVNYDDVEFLVDNPQAQGLSPGKLAWAFTHFYVEGYYPVRLVSLALDQQLWGGPDPMGFHLTNLLLHLANIWLLYLLALRASRAAGGPDPRRAALAAAALFAVHPAAVQTVGWIMGREELLMTFFYLACLILHDRAVRSPAASLLLHVLAGYAALFSGLSHVTAMTLPVAAGLFQAMAAGQRRWKKLLAQTSYLWVIAGFVAFLRFLSLVTYDEKTQALLFPKVADALANLPLLAAHARLNPGAAAESLGPGLVHGLHKWLLLSGDAVFPFFWPSQEMPDSAGVDPARLVLCAAVIAFAVIFLRRPGNKGLFSFGILWFGACLYLPAAWVTGLVPPGRFFYLPVAALCVAGGALAARAMGARPRAAWGLFLTVVFLYAAMSAGRLGTYRDGLAFHEQGVKEYPGYWKAHYNIGTHYTRLDRFEDAAREFEKAARLDPGQDLPWISLVRLALTREWTDKALAWAGEMVREGPASGERRALLGMALDRVGREEEALAEIRRALVLDPEHPAILGAYGAALLDRGEGRRAIPFLEKALARYPYMAQVQGDLARALEEAGRPEEAREHREMARELRSGAAPPGGRVMPMPVFETQERP